MAISPSILRYGSRAPLPERLALRAGPLSMIYENGDVRYVRFGAVEIIRRIYAAVRDQNWGTAPNVLSGAVVEVGADHFHIAYEAHSELGEIKFAWNGAISGDNQGNLSIEMDGEAQTTFLRNRIGFCVLHPLSLGGARCQIEHLDGSVEEAVFPVGVAPQLFREGRAVPAGAFNAMRAMRYELAPDRWVEVRFEGDVFELEDQRNWIDGSYKTYCTPLHLPLPVEVAQGTRIRQRITARLSGQPPALLKEEAPDQAHIDLHAGVPLLRLPRIGLESAGHGQPLSAREVDRLRKLHLSHLRIELRLAHADWRTRLIQAAAEARRLDVALEIALFLGEEAGAELSALMRSLAEIRPRVALWWVFREGERTSSERWLALARSPLAAYDPAARIGGGSDAHLAEFQRGQLPLHLVDAVCFSATPQVHAFDNLSIAETPEALEAAARTAHQAAGGMPVAVTPITFKQRFNPVASAPERESAPGELPPQVDPRQMSLFGAGWTLATLKALLESGVVEAATYFQTTGWLGVMETESGSPLPDEFPALPGSVFPVYHLLADVGEFGADVALPCRSSSPLHVSALALRRAGRDRLLIANLSDGTQTVTIQHGASQGRLRVLDDRNAESAMTDPEAFREQPTQPIVAAEGRFSITLPPFALARLDIDR